MHIEIEPLNATRNMVAISAQPTLNQAVRLYNLGGWLPNKNDAFTGLVWDFPAQVTEAQILEALESETVHHQNS